MCSFVFKLVQDLFKCVQMWSNLFKTCSNVLKCVQTCSKLVQMYSNVFICVQTCSKLVLMWCAMGLTQHSCKTNVPRWRDVNMNTFFHSPVNPLLVDIASYSQRLTKTLRMESYCFWQAPAPMRLQSTSKRLNFLYGSKLPQPLGF